jgi:threonylcarbamoyladenosine tRNA methylthiotransferase MtaB
MKVALFTIGCKVNQYETEAIAEKLETYGLQRVDFSDQADIYIINTCTVTKESDYSSRQAIYRAKRKSPDAKIVVTGCYAQMEKEFLESLPGVSMVVKQENKGMLPSMVMEMFGSEKEESLLDRGALQGEPFRVNPHPELQMLRSMATLQQQYDLLGLCVKGLAKHTRALVKIQDGCEKNCAYCVVPFARGKERCREVHQILSEINSLGGNGYKEIILTGVHIGRYNNDGVNLAELSEEILKETKVERIRYSSIDPKEFSQQLIDFVSQSDRICRHLHIPLQSGDDLILLKMRRDYSTEEYRKLVDKLTQAIPDVMIGADVIVGFPGETDQQFENTYNFITYSLISYLHVFSYSDRKGTEASSMLNKTPPEVIRQRSEILHNLGTEKWRKYIDRFIGKRLNVLIENRRDRKTGKLTGLSDNYIRVLLDGDDDLKNTIVPINIVRREENKLIGEILYTCRDDS